MSPSGQIPEELPSKRQGDVTEAGVVQEFLRTRLGCRKLCRRDYMELFLYNKFPYAEKTSGSSLSRTRRKKNAALKCLSYKKIQ